MPRLSDHLVKSSIKLLRQSTQVPNTSNTSAFTSEISAMASLPFSVCCCSRLQLLAVLDEARPLGDLVVERLRGLVGLVRQPVQAAGAGRACGGLDGRNQRTPRAAAAYRRLDEQIFEIAIADRRPGRAMQQIVREPDQFAVALGDQRMQRSAAAASTPSGAPPVPM